ncbi:hypothetical protein [Dactylosporangium sp. CA-139066]|uniref:hypothetical protein n=1 Tax=Dactylosporangium sp. CA-139066 TaxID=3239930 RepID=UPI003D91F84C
MPDVVFAEYRERGGVIDEGFRRRRELWWLHAYLAVVAVVGGGMHVGKISAVVRS